MHVCTQVGIHTVLHMYFDLVVFGSLIWFLYTQRLENNFRNRNIGITCDDGWFLCFQLIGLDV